MNTDLKRLLSTGQYCFERYTRYYETTKKEVVCRETNKKIDVTVNIYQHLTDDLKAQGVAVLNEIFTNK